MTPSEKRQKYLTDCYTRKEFFSFYESNERFNIKSFDSSQREEFSDFSLKGDDSLDFTIHTIHYPEPLVTQIFIKNWAGGWESDQSSLRFQYQYWDDYTWKMTKILKFENPKRLEETDEIIQKCQIFPEIIQFINHIDPERAKQLLRNFNLNQLV